MYNDVLFTYFKEKSICRLTTVQNNLLSPIGYTEKEEFFKFNPLPAGVAYSMSFHQY